MGAAINAIKGSVLTNDYLVTATSNISNTTATDDTGNLGSIAQHICPDGHTVEFNLNGKIITTTVPIVIQCQYDDYPTNSWRGQIKVRNGIFFAAPTYNTNNGAILKLRSYDKWNGTPVLNSQLWTLSNLFLSNHLISSTQMSCLQFHQYDYGYCKLYNIKIYVKGFPLSNATVGLHLSAQSATPVPPATTVRWKTIENISVYGDTGNSTGIQMPSHAYASFKNVFSCSPVAAGFVNWLYDATAAGNSDFSYCADNDSSLVNGTNIIHGINNTEFESVDPTNQYFLHPNRGHIVSTVTPSPARGKAPLRINYSADTSYGFPAGMRIYTGGTTPTLTSLDYGGIQYGKWGYLPIGCHNAEVAY